MITATGIRKDARNHLTGKWGKGALITLCYFLVEFLIQFIVNALSRNALLSLIGSVGQLLISVPLTYGILISFMKLKRNEEVEVFDFLTLSFSNFSRAWKVFFSMLRRLIVPIILCIVSYVIIASALGVMIFSLASDSISSATSSFKVRSQYAEDLEEARLDLSMAKAEYMMDETLANRMAVEEAEERIDEIIASKYSYEYSDEDSNDSNSSLFGGAIILLGFVLLFASGIYLFVKQLSYSLSYNIAYDEPQLTSKEAVAKSKLLMTGNRSNYFVLSLSFIGWAILSVFTLGIGYFWLLPYIQVSYVCFYDKIREQAQ